jgi:hypothetical protein
LATSTSPLASRLIASTLCLSNKPHIDTFAITGGTGEFVGAAGAMEQASSKADPAGVALTLTLVD